jgi:hypothetical protein
MTEVPRNHIELPQAALAGYLSAQLVSLHGVHPEVVYEAILSAQRALNLTIYIDAPMEAERTVPN